MAQDDEASAYYSPSLPASSKPNISARILPANKEQVCALQINNNSDEFSCVSCLPWLFLLLYILADKTQ